MYRNNKLISLAKIKCKYFMTLDDNKNVTILKKEKIYQVMRNEIIDVSRETLKRS